MTRLMRISKAGADFIKGWEGLETEAYRDIAGVWTIGYGHTEGFQSGRFNQATVIDAGEADALLREDLRAREEAVRRLVKVPLNQNEFDALVSFEFNTGGLERSTALRRLNAGKRLAAAEALTWWNKATIGGRKTTVPGLARRRAAEAVLFLKPSDPSRRDRCGFGRQRFKPLRPV